MKFQLTTLVAVLCFQCSVFSMYDSGCSWKIDMICIQTHNGPGLGNSKERMNSRSNQSTLRPYKDSNQKLIKGAKVFSNPTESLVYTVLELSEGIRIHMDILSSEGTVYLSLNHKASKGKQAFNMDVSNLPRGAYTLQVYAEKESLSLEFMR